VKLDLLTIRRIMGIVSGFVPIQGLDAYYHQIRLMILEELDFVREAEASSASRRTSRKIRRVRFPRAHRELSTRA
jgi:ubiquinone biosynthesis protein